MNQAEKDKRTYFAFLRNPDVFLEMDDMKVMSKATALGCMEKLKNNDVPTTIVLWKHTNNHFKVECYAFIYFNPRVYSSKDAGFIYYRVKPDIILFAGLIHAITKIHKIEIKETQLLDIFTPNN